MLSIEPFGSALSRKPIVILEILKIDNMHTVDKQPI